MSRAALSLGIRRKRRLHGAEKWSTETVYAITDLSAEQATAARQTPRPCDVGPFSSFVMTPS
jgi:hypothetical protein